MAGRPLHLLNGSTGITLHLVVNQEIAAADADADLDPVWTDFDVIKGKYFTASRAPYFDRNGRPENTFPASQNDWAALRFDGGGQIGFATLGLTQDLDREALFLVTPEKMEPCLTAEQSRAR